MGKRTRIILYALSLVTMLAMVTLIIFSHGRQSGEPAKDALSETDISSTEEPVQIPEAEEPEETEAADGQNGIQNDTEQEEVDIADDTTLIFAGDVLFANAFKSNYDAGGIEKVIEPQLLQELQDADIFMVNNEFPFSNRGEPMEDKQFTFCCDPKYVKALNEMGVDIVSLANNHTLDYGRDALSDTFTTLDGAGILYAGAGETKERAYELQIIEKNGKRTNNLPNASDNRVCHVRPHGQNASDTYPLPDGKEYTKQCFWLNNSYILSQIDKKFLED